jgi:hypothetical protein
MIAGTVAPVLPPLQNGNRGLGCFPIGMLGMAWAPLTSFVASVIVVEKRGAAEAFQRSGALFREPWGESAAGRGSIGIVSFLRFLLLGAVVSALASAHQATAAIVLAIVGVAVLAVLFTALQAVWVAALYRYATAHEIPARYGGAAVEDAFAPK